MVIANLPVGRRVWFFDPRSPERRMSVSAHPDEDVVVVSLWQGQRCTGTFRLPTADSSRLIATLADGMAARVSRPALEHSGPRGRARVGAWIRRVFPWPPLGPGGGLRLLK
jgi:hypothetical protein